MAAIQIVDGRTSLWQWDTGVRIKVYGCSEIDQMHFVTPGGIISKDLVDSECNVPDAALQIAGLLKMYAYDRTDTGAITRHDFVLMVNARPKPADYIDPPDEIDNLQALAERVAGMITPEAGGGVTAEAITDALGYTPADEKTVDAIKKDLESLKNSGVGGGLTVDKDGNATIGGNTFAVDENGNAVV